MEDLNRQAENYLALVSSLVFGDPICELRTKALGVCASGIFASVRSGLLRSVTGGSGGNRKDSKCP